MGEMSCIILNFQAIKKKSNVFGSLKYNVLFANVKSPTRHLGVFDEEVNKENILIPLRSNLNSLNILCLRCTSLTLV